MKSNFGKLGFILAALGSSIGLGHIWRFPTAAGMNGGSAFVLLYLAIALTIGVAMLIAEMLIGQHGRKNVPDCFKVISQNKKTKWRYMGIILITGPITLTFYCAVLGWVLYYLFSVSFSLPRDIMESGAIFEAFSTKNDYLWCQIGCFGVILFATAYFVVHGISGIERLNFVLMPLLFFIFFGLLFYAMSLSSFQQSLMFMFKPDFSKLDSNVITDAMGQVFFSLSLGAGSILTYSSHISKRQNLLSSCLFIVLSGILISLVAGLMIFTFVFEYEGSVNEGVGLIFITLPVMFGKMGAFGSILSVLFMAGLLLAGISSTVSLLEPCVKYLHDRTNKSRAKITYLVAFGIFLVGIIIILSLNENFRNALSLFGKSLFDLSINLSANVLLTWGSFFGSIFIGYFVPRATLRNWTALYFKNDFIFSMWYYCLRILAPLMILIIFANKIYDIYR